MCSAVHAGVVRGCVGREPDCSDLAPAKPLPTGPACRHVGTIARSEQSVLFRCRNNAESGAAPDGVGQEQLAGSVLANGALRAVVLCALEPALHTGWESPIRL
jgi:hypothetical protein